MEQTVNTAETDVEIESLKDEISKLKSELRTANRELTKHNRAKATIESNLNVKMNMFRALANENVKHKRFLTNMMKNSVDFLLLLDEGLNVVCCSDLFLRKIGMKYISEIEGRHIFDVYSMLSCGEVFDQIKDGVTTAREKGETSRLDVVADLNGNEGQRSYRITNTPMLEEQVLRGVIVNWSDMTDIINSKNEAERANKSKSGFLAVMSHEIRTPMNVILGIAQIELQKGNLSDEYAAALKMISSSGSTLLGIINDILDMSKIETGKLELNPAEYELPNLISDMVKLNIVRIGSKPIEFTLDIDEKLPLRVFGDELRIKQILNNLLSNAIKYTEKGYVKLSISHTGEKDNLILCFAVEDTGQGMKEEDQKLLFSEYSRFNAQANRATEGTGLGLNIVRSLVEMMGGTVKVESEYGKGSTFTITIKQEIREYRAIGTEIAERLRSFRFDGDRQTCRTEITRDIMAYGSVLVVDDVETNLYVTEGLLAPYKLNIETATSGFTAIDKIKSGKIYDIIFMDHMMPQMDGIETTQKLRELGYSGVIVALTANALVGNDELFAKNGFNGFIPKPVDVRQLNSILNKFVRDRHQEESRVSLAQCPSDPIKPEKKLSPRLIQAFQTDTQRAVSFLREFLNSFSMPSADSDIKLFITTVHAMKSVLANVGEDTASAQASELENAGQRGDTDFITANTEAFIETLESLLKTIVN